jgi:hypothetical protein
MEPILQEIVTLRSTVAHEFRKTLSAEKPDKDKVFMSIKRYGVLDGILSCKAAECFASIYQSMSEDQKTKLIQLRNLDTYPSGTYLFSDPVEIPKKLDCSSLLHF